MFSLPYPQPVLHIDSEKYAMNIKSDTDSSSNLHNQLPQNCIPKFKALQINVQNNFRKHLIILSIVLII